MILLDSVLDEITSNEVEGAVLEEADHDDNEVEASVLEEFITDQVERAMLEESDMY